MQKFIKYISIASLLLIPSSSFAQTYTYDNLGRVKTVTNNGVTITYNNDAADNRTSVTNGGASPPPPPPPPPPSSNNPPVCQNIVQTIGAPWYATPSVALSLSSIIGPNSNNGICSDPNGDVLTLVSANPALAPTQHPLTSTITFYFTVTDNKGGTASGTFLFKR